MSHVRVDQVKSIKNAAAVYKNRKSEINKTKNTKLTIINFFDFNKL